MGKAHVCMTPILCRFHALFQKKRARKGRCLAFSLGCLGVFIALFFVVFIDYLRSIFKNAYIEWDVKTITAGDYSVEIEITDSMWKTFLT